MIINLTLRNLFLILLLSLGQIVKAQDLTVTINKKTVQAGASRSPVVFKVLFNRVINAGTFSAANIELSGTATGASVTAITQVSPFDGKNFEVTVRADNNGTVIATIPAVTYQTSTFYSEATDITNPIAIIFDGSAYFYTANYNTNNVTKISMTGASTIIGNTGAGSHPNGLALNSQGDLYISNYGNKTVFKIPSGGVVATKFADVGIRPVGIAVDGLDNVYVANSGNNNVNKITPAGDVSIFGTTDDTPFYMVIDGFGTLYIANSVGNKVTKITSDGIKSTFGYTGAGPYGITFDNSGTVCTANSSDNTITKITQAGLTTTFNTGGVEPKGIVVDGVNNLYVANYTPDGNNTYNISKITPTGVSTIIPIPGVSPNGIVMDNSGNIYTCNENSNSVTKITPFGIAISGTNTPANEVASTSSNNTYTLPVKLLNFSAVYKDCKPMLNWQTSAEVNSSYYGIETSLDGKIFIETARLSSKNNAAGAKYAYSFKDIATGATYYRLKITDIDGDYSYSKTEILTANNNCAAINQPSASPNPAKDFVIVKGLVIGNQLTLINASGKLLSSIEATSKTQRIDISTYANGIYILRINDDNGKLRTLKIVKQNN